jgi:hypothetical protein
VLVGSLAASPAEAASITLRLFPELTWTEATLSLALEVLNEGDTTARAVVPVLWFSGKSVRADVHPALAPGDTYEAKLTLPAPPPAPGRWPYRIAVDYTDASRHPSQALAVGTLVAGEPPPVDVAARDVPTLRFSRSGALALRLANQGTEPRSLTLRAHVPQGLELAEPLPPVELLAGQERVLEVLLHNANALPGSRYAVFVSAEYAAGGVHQTLVVPASVEIVATEPLLEARASWLYGAAAALVVIWCARVLWLRRASRR